MQSKRPVFKHELTSLENFNPLRLQTFQWWNIWVAVHTNIHTHSTHIHLLVSSIHGPKSLHFAAQEMVSPSSELQQYSRAALMCLVQLSGLSCLTTPNTSSLLLCYLYSESPWKPFCFIVLSFVRSRMPLLTHI